jgi:pentatricopeptide repeat protein
MKRFEESANRQTKDRQNLCSVCNYLALCYLISGFFQVEKSRVLYDRASVIGEEAGHSDREELGRVLRNFGALCRRLGEHDKAIGLLEQGSAITRELGERSGEGDSYNNLAECYKEMGQFEKAIQLYEQSAVIFEDLGDSINLSMASQGHGECLAFLGHYPQAIEQHKKFLALSQNPGHNWSVVLAELSSAHALERHAQAALNIGATLWKQLRAGRAPNTIWWLADAEAELNERNTYADHHPH